MADVFLFKIFPYLALTIAIVGTIWRFRADKFSYSAVSSEFFGKKSIFVGSVPWHYGIAFALIIHFIAFVFPAIVLRSGADAHTLIYLEVFNLSCGFLAVFGIVVLFIRRLVNGVVKVNTSAGDWICVILLAFQAISGVIIAIDFQWGIYWMASNVSPYIFSLLSFKPDISFVADFPILVKLHFFNAFLIVTTLPFTRLVHIFSIPVTFPFRKNIIVRWNRKRPHRQIVSFVPGQNGGSLE